MSEVGLRTADGVDGAGADAARASRDDGRAAGVVKVSFPVVGMTCAACVSRVQRQLAATAGVRDAAVNLATNKATVELERGAVPAGGWGSKSQ